MNRLLLLTFLLFSAPLLAHTAAPAPKESASGISTPSTEAPVHTLKKKKNLLSALAFGMALTGAILIWMPYVSLLGLLLGLAGWVTGYIAQKKGQKNPFSRIAIILGSLCFLYFAITLGLLLFF